MEVTNLISRNSNLETRQATEDSMVLVELLLIMNCCDFSLDIRIANKLGNASKAPIVTYLSQ